MEREMNKDKILERLTPDMRTLYDQAIKAYRRYCIKPEIEAEEDAKGQILKVSFNKIPRRVMSKIYDSTMEAKDKIDCKFTLEYKLLATDDNFRCRFEIRK